MKMQFTSIPLNIFGPLGKIALELDTSSLLNFCATNKKYKKYVIMIYFGK